MTQTARGSSPEDRRGTSSPRTGAGGATVSQTARFDTLWTGRLLMRRLQDSDREPFAGLNGDPETMLFFPAPLSRAASDALIDRIESCFDDLGYGLWALEVAATGEFIGFTGLNPMPDDVPGAPGQPPADLDAAGAGHIVGHGIEPGAADEFAGRGDLERPQAIAEPVEAGLDAVD